MAVNAKVKIEYDHYLYVVEVELGVWWVTGSLCFYCLRKSRQRIKEGYPFTVIVNEIRQGGCLMDPGLPLCRDVTVMTLLGLGHGTRVCPDHYQHHKKLICDHYAIC